MDRKWKFEEDYESQSESENSPSKRKRHSLDFKLKVISELESSYYSELARKYKIERSCIQDWKKLDLTKHVASVHECEVRAKLNL